MTLIFVFWQGFRGPDGIKYGVKKVRFKGVYKPIGEVQICRILPNRAIIAGILYWNRKGAFYGVFYIAYENQGENRSPNWAYFPLTVASGKRGMLGSENSAGQKRDISPLHNLPSKSQTTLFTRFLSKVIAY